MVDEFARFNIKTGDGSKHGRIGVIGYINNFPHQLNRSHLPSFLSLVTCVKCTGIFRTVSKVVASGPLTGRLLAAS